MTIFSIAAAAAGQLWLARADGLHCRQAAWQPCTTLPLFQPLALACTADAALLLAGGVPSSIAYSGNGGSSWQLAWIDEIESPITCFAVSPRFASDRVLLAGTQHAGVLRSTDGGRHWRLSGAGLRTGSVLALLALPPWDDREMVLAATDDGVYHSPNGGRAWQRAGLAGQVIQALSAGPAALYAGSEAGEIARSSDGAASWEMLALPSATGPINCLWSDGQNPLLLAGTADGAILYSANGGDNWQRVWTGATAISALAADATTLYAGCADGGLLLSHDWGQTWERDLGLAASQAAGT